MSILNGPRLNFWGGIRTDVSLPNNSPTMYYNGIKNWPIFDLTTSTLAPTAQSYSDDQLNSMINAPTGDYYTAGGWNHYGQHVVDMKNVLISSQGSPGSVSTTGDMVGQPVYLLGSVDPVTGQGPVSGPMMVDLDPTSTTTTQIFVGGLQIGGSNDIQLLIHANTVCSSQDLGLRVLQPETDSPGSCRISGTFQLTFPLSSIVSWNQNSSGLRSIIQAPGATGIVLRFVMFEMCPTMTTPQLQADYAAGTDTPNPSIGRVIGTLAPAFADEPLNCQPGRQLVNQNTGGTGYADLGSNGILSIDMVNVIPKQNFRAVRDDITSPIGPNANYGPVTVAAGDTDLSTLDPTSSPLFDYYVYGGIVDLPLSASQQQAVHSCALAIDAPDTVLNTELHATESEYRVYADQRNVYTEDYPAGLSITLQVRYLGGPVSTTTEIDLTAAPPGPYYTQQRYCDFLYFPPALTVSPGQLAVTFSVNVKPSAAPFAGFVALTYTVNGQESGTYFTNFRKYAQTDFGIPKGTTITWEQMYPNVLRFHYLAFPAMSRYIPLNQPDAIMGAKNPILARTSDAYKGTTLFMPVVRSMSPCQRALLRAYLTGEPWQPPQ